jgi:hypothetical protein
MLCIGIGKFHRSGETSSEASKKPDNSTSTKKKLPYSFFAWGKKYISIPWGREEGRLGILGRREKQKHSRYRQNKNNSDERI